MKRLSLAALLVISLAFVGSVHAKGNEGFGLGVIAGEPTGLSLKWWIGNDQAIDGGIAWSFSENDSLHLHADYLWHRFDLFNIPASAGKLPLYFGVGGRIKLEEDSGGNGNNDNDDLLGVRIPVGVAFIFADAPVDIFAEIVPVLDLVPDTDFDLNAAIGARFYF